MTKTKRTHALNSGDLLGGLPRHDAHVVTRTLRAVTVVFWPRGCTDSQAAKWSYHQPELTDAEMAHAAAGGLTGLARVYRGVSCVNTLRDTPSAELDVFTH